jgi:hypothetical protein
MPYDFKVIIWDIIILIDILLMIFLISIRHCFMHPFGPGIDVFYNISITILVIDFLI